MSGGTERPAISGPKRLIVGISGASGTVYGLRMVEACRALGVETHLILSKAAAQTLRYESELTLSEVNAMADFNYRPGDIGAAVASGSFKTMGMVVAPCSIKTMGEIANGVTASLLSRAADVVLKERRRLVLMVRETPFHTGHLRTMTALSEMGAIIAPPLPALYADPQTVQDIVDHSVGRVLDLFGLDAPGIARWGETAGPRPGASPPEE